MDGSLRWHGLDPQLLRLWRLLTGLSVGVPAVVLAALTFWLAGLTEGLAVVLLALVVLGQLLWVVQRRFAAWAYAERADDLILQRGVLLRRTTVVPYGRMQFVDVSAGPLDRRYGLAKVVLHTASPRTDSTIPGLTTDQATRLRDRLAALGEARAAGL